MSKPKYYPCKNELGTHLIHFGDDEDSTPVLAIFPESDMTYLQQGKLARSIAHMLNQKKKKKSQK